MIAVDFFNGPSYEVVVTGDRDSDDTLAMLRVLGERFIPNKVVLFVPDDKTTDITDIADYTKSYKSIRGKATAYVCINFTCKLPVTSISEMLKLLE
jgi:uncharacterized protein YyaL (SSP411 family)